MLATNGWFFSEGSLAQQPDWITGPDRTGPQHPADLLIYDLYLRLRHSTHAVSVSVLFGSWLGKKKVDDTS